MILEQIAITLDVAGKVLISYTVLKVHHRMLREHMIDDLVTREIKLEQLVGVIGIILMLIGYMIKMLVYAGLL